MGFGNKMHPEKIELATIEKTSVCPMARTVRRILKKKGIPVFEHRIDADGNIKVKQIHH